MCKEGSSYHIININNNNWWNWGGWHESGCITHCLSGADIWICIFDRVLLVDLMNINFCIVSLYDFPLGHVVVGTAGSTGVSQLHGVWFEPELRLLLFPCPCGFPVVPLVSFYLPQTCQ